MPDNCIYSIAIDNEANKWLGTQGGLAKFDGINWTVYDTSNSGVPSNFIVRIAIDGNDIKWIGTGDGLVRYDGSNWTEYNASNSCLSSNGISCIAIDGNNNKWISTSSGLAIFKEGGIVLVHEQKEKVMHFLDKFILGQNYPNPFNPSTTIKYSIPKQSYVTLKVYDILGREVQTLFNEEKPAGNYQVEFDAAELPSGVYFYRIKAGSFSQVRKMLLIK